MSTTIETTDFYLVSYLITKNLTIKGRAEIMAK
jgi:hypothetical protein